MKKYLQGLEPLALAFFGMAILASSSWATTANWTNGAGTSSWETPKNWDINQVPRDNTFDVKISISAQCNLSSGFQIGGLNLSANSSLGLVPGSILGIASASGISNDGIIVVNTTEANSPTTLRFDTSAPIDGSGSILLNGLGAFNVANLDLAGHTVTIGANHTILGQGTILSNGGLLINNGTIIGSNSSGRSMQLDLTYNDGVRHKNNGTLKATNGGVLGLYSGIMDQTGGGSFLADGNGSMVQIGGSNNGAVVGATVIGGTLNTSNGGIIRIIGGNGALLTGTTNNGTIEIPGNETLYIRGTGLINNGTILVNSTDPTNSTSQLEFDHSGTLGGTGAVILNGAGFNRANLKYAGGSTLTIGSGETVQGYGTISGDGMLINNGTIIGNDPTGKNMQIDPIYNDGVAHQNNGLIWAANGGVVGLYSGIIDQTGGGLILADGNGSIVQLGGNNNGGLIGVTVIGGRFGTINGGVIQVTPGSNGALLVGGTNNGAIEIPGGETLFVKGRGLTNNGTILVDPTADSATTKLFFSEDGTLDGRGSLTLNGIPSRSNVAGFDCGGHTVINGADHTIKGIGDLFVSGGLLTNSGTIAPGFLQTLKTFTIPSPGQLNIAGNLALAATSNLSFAVGGKNPGTDYSVLNKSGAPLALHGTLNVSMVNGFVPASTDSFTILTTPATLTGAFSNVPDGGTLVTVDGYGSFVVNYSGNNVVLSSFQQITPPSTPTPTPTPVPTPTPTATPTPTPVPGDIFVGNSQGPGLSFGHYTTAGETVNENVASLTFFPFSIAASGTHLFFTNGQLPGGSGVSEYTTSGQLLDIAKVRIINPIALAVSGRDLFVLRNAFSSESTPAIAKFTTAGETVNADFIALPPNVSSFAVADGKIFVAYQDNSGWAIAEYTTAGETVNTSLMTGLPAPAALAVQGDNLFLMRTGESGAIGKYTTSGATIDPDFIPGLKHPNSIAIYGGHLFVTDLGDGISSYGHIGEYDATSGATINSSLISLPLSNPVGLVIVPHLGNTSVGSNVVLFPSGRVTVTFSQVTAEGETSVVPIDPSSAGSPPSGYTVNGGQFAYEIHSTATVIPPIEVCFQGPFSSADGGITNLRVLHRENGMLVDRTSRLDFNTGGGEVCGRVDSLSPFVLATTNAPFNNPGSQLLNISTRLNVQTGDNALIGGFILTGKDPKRVIVRAIGPSLGAFGVQGALSDPVLELHDSTGAVIATNDNWKREQDAVELTGIAPTDNRESAIVATLPANGAGYTAVLGGNNNTTGIGVVEIYDLSEIANARLANISSRGFVDTGDNAMIGGFILGGGGSSNVVVRAIGPTLGAFGVSGSLQDPTLELRDSNGTLLVFNDNWQDDSSAAEIQTNNLAPGDPKESAVLRSLSPGAYTAIVRGNNNTTGVGLVEVYNLQ